MHLVGQVSHLSEKVDYFVILSGAKNLSWFYTNDKEREILRSAQNDKMCGDFSAAC